MTHASYCRCADCIDAENRVVSATVQTADSRQVPMPRESVSMPQYWSVRVTKNGSDLISIGSDWLSGNSVLEAQDEQTILGAAQHLLSFVGYGLPECAFDPEEPSPAAAEEAGRIANEEVIANWLSEQWHREVANRPLANVHRAELDAKWRQLLSRVGVDHRARLGPTHEELLADALKAVPSQEGSEA